MREMGSGVCMGSPINDVTDFVTTVLLPKSMTMGEGDIKKIQICVTSFMDETYAGNTKLHAVFGKLMMDIGRYCCKVVNIQ
jgi:hypothetical protein